MAMNPDELASMDLVVDARHPEEAPPPAARARVLAAARAARAPEPPSPRLDPVECYGRTVDALDAVLSALPAQDWQAGVREYGWSIQGLVGHVVAVERYMATLLGADDLVLDPAVERDHVGMSQPWVDAQAGRPPADTLADWRAAAATVREVLAVRPRLEDEVVFHGLSLRLGSLLVLRTFELWTHDEDVRRAAGLPMAPPEVERLELMTALAVRALPLGLYLAGRAAPGRTAKLVLTGSGGGTFVQPLGLGDEPAGPPDVRIETDVVDFCRLAARRLRPEQLDVVVEGDAALGSAVLVGAAVFAA